MFKISLILAILMSASMAQAALNVNCEAWSKDSNSTPTYDIQMTLPFTIGKKFNNMPTAPSQLTVIEKNYSENKVQQNIIFNDSVSHLNSESAKGLFDTVVIDTYPIGKDTNPLHPPAVKEEVRRLSLTLKMLDNEKDSDQPIDLSSLSFEVKQGYAQDHTFTGSGSISANGKSNKDLSFRCSVYVALNIVERLIEKTKK